MSTYDCHVVRVQIGVGQHIQLNLSKHAPPCQQTNRVLAPARNENSGHHHANKRAYKIATFGFWQLAKPLILAAIVSGFRHVSHEAIYNALYLMPRGSLKKELMACLRQGQGKHALAAVARIGDN